MSKAPTFFKAPEMAKKFPLHPKHPERAHFAERDRRFRGIVTDAGMLHGYGLMLP